MGICAVDNQSMIDKYLVDCCKDRTQSCFDCLLVLGSTQLYQNCHVAMQPFIWRQGWPVRPCLAVNLDLIEQLSHGPALISQCSVNGTANTHSLPHASILAKGHESGSSELYLGMLRAELLMTNASRKIQMTFELLITIRKRLVKPEKCFHDDAQTLNAS